MFMKEIVILMITRIEREVNGTNTVFFKEKHPTLKFTCYMDPKARQTCYFDVFKVCILWACVSRKKAAQHKGFRLSVLDTLI